jgi:hypothetical protein
LTIFDNLRDFGVVDPYGSGLDCKSSGFNPRLFNSTPPHQLGYHPKGVRVHGDGFAVCANLLNIYIISWINISIGVIDCYEYKRKR